MSGANTVAIGDGTPDTWEILQFQKAVPIADRQFSLTNLLRGQAGSRGLIPDVWPVGSRIVILDGVAEQITLPSASRGNARHFRYGPAKRPFSDASFKYATFTFQGNGLRPYPVAHLRAKRVATGFDVSWIRCSRIDGDIWSQGDIPLGEESENYLIRIIQSGIIRRTETVTTTSWKYDAANMAVEVGGLPFRLEVAQVSARFGPGLVVPMTLQG